MTQLLTCWRMSHPLRKKKIKNIYILKKTTKPHFVWTVAVLSPFPDILENYMNFYINDGAVSLLLSNAERLSLSTQRLVVQSQRDAQYQLQLPILNSILFK